MLSTSGRDYPVPVVKLGGPAPSAVLGARAQAAGREPARLYRLDHGSWVLEDARGRLVGTLGGLPGKLEGYDAAGIDLPDAARAGHAAAEWTASSRASLRWGGTCTLLRGIDGLR